MTSRRLIFAAFTMALAGTSAAQAPLPDAALGAPVDPNKGYYVQEVADGLYWVTEGAYMTMFLTTGDGVIVIDAPPNLGGMLLLAIDEVTDEPITHVIYSHSHADHIGAVALLPATAIYIAHEDTLAQLQRARPTPFGMFLGGSEVPLPTVTFSDSYTLTVGTQTLELTYRGDDHEPGNIYTRIHRMIW